MSTAIREIDYLAARRDTPGCEQVIHFDNAGASLMPLPVLNAMLEHLELEAAIGGYAAQARAHDRLEHAYDALARLLGCSRDEVAVVENATRAWDMAFYALPIGGGDRILTSVAEYASNYIPFLQVCRRTGATVQVIPNDGYGQISVAALREAIDERVRLIALTHVPTNGGLVNPADEVGRVARSAGIPFLLDACQSVGQMPVNIDDIGCDMLSATGRKFLRGPRAIGFLYVRRGFLETLEPPFLDLHAAEWVGQDQYRIRPDARRFENWETNCAAKIGLGVAVDYALEWGLESIERRVTALADLLRSRLAELPGVTVTDVGRRQCAIVTFKVRDTESKRIRDYLGARQINVTVSDASATRLDFEARNLPPLVRASVHYFNTEAEIDCLCDELRRALSCGALV